MEAIRLDIFVDQNGEARRVLDDLEIHYLKTGKSAEEAAKGVQKFEEQYKDTTAKADAKKALDALRKGHEDAGEAAKQQAAHAAKLSETIMRFAGPAVVLAAAKNTLSWADSIQDLADRTKFSTTAVQQMGKVAEQSGTSFGSLANLVQVAEQRLVDGNKKALAAVATMGLSVDTLLAMKPEDRLRALAVGLHDIEDPAKRSAAEMAVFGRSADANAVALDKLAEGADKAKLSLGESFIKTGADAQDMLDDLASSAMDVVRAFLLWPAALSTAAGQMGKDSTLGTMFEMLGWHGSRATPAPGLPGAPRGAGSWMPSPLAPGGDPFGPEGVGGQSLSFIERTLGIKFPRPKKAPEPVIPYTANQWANIGAQYAFGANPLGNGGLGRFPGWATPMDPIRNSMSRDLLGIGFGRNSNPVGFSSASMVSPASLLGNQSLWGRITGFASGRGGQIAGGAVSLLSGLIPGQSRMGQGIGSLLGSFIPGLGPLGGALGGLVGGTVGRLFGTDPKKLARNAEIGEVFKQFSSKDFIALQREADRLGVSLEKALNAKTMNDFSAAVDEAAEKIRELNEQQAEIDDLTRRTTVSFDDMNDIVAEFGLDASKMGQAFKQAAVDKEAQRIIDAFAVMERGGADMNGVLEGMADEISGVVNQSIEFGTTIPSNMKPWIEQLIASGKLLDKDGKAIKDMSGIKFADPLVSEMDKLLKKLSDLIDAINGVSNGFGNAEDAAAGFNKEAGRTPKDGPWNSTNPYSGPDDATVNVSRGGIVGRNGLSYFAGGGFVPRGTDIVPAMLTPGEMVTSAGATKAILAALRERGGGRVGDVNVVVIDGRANNDAVVEKVFGRMPREVAANGPLKTKLKKALGVARV